MQPACARARAAERQFLKRASAHNALTRVFQELPERPKRVTDHRNEDELGYETTITSRWDEIDAAWQRGEHPVVNRLMAEAERGVRALHRSAGSPVGQLREPNRLVEWEEERKTYSIVRDDASSAGELWLGDRSDAAVELAKRQQAQNATDLKVERRYWRDPPESLIRWRRRQESLEIVEKPHEITGWIELGSVGSIIAGELEAAA